MTSNENWLSCGFRIHYDFCRNPCEDYCEDYGDLCKRYGGYCFDYDECPYKREKSKDDKY